MSSYDNRYNDIDDEPDFDYVNDDYGFDMDDDNCLPVLLPELPKITKRKKLQNR